MLLAGVTMSIAGNTLGHTVVTLQSTCSCILDDDTRIGLAAVPDYGLEVAAGGRSRSPAMVKKTAAPLMSR